MKCEEARFKVQALFDRELEEEDINDVVRHIESCYLCRKEYTDLLRLESKLKGIAYNEPPREWFEDLEKIKWKKRTGKIGYILFFTSYILLLGNTVVGLLTDPAQSLLVRVTVAGISTGLLILFFLVLTDRFSERHKEEDRYKGVMK